ncbi:MAG: tetratricopeptide repeat protein [Candidatus Thorarchaeota archaeon]|jgi:tetratricopeptide (TPR) repeat protein
MRSNEWIQTTNADHLEYLIHSFWNEVSAMELVGYGIDAKLEKLYTLGYNFFSYGKYHRAREIFVNLTNYAPFRAYYWRALGAVNQQMKDYAEAISAYDMATEKDDTDVVSYLYRAESQILSGNDKSGVSDLKKVVKIGSKLPDMEPWVKRAKLLLKIHKKRRAS